MNDTYSGRASRSAYQYDNIAREYPSSTFDFDVVEGAGRNVSTSSAPASVLGFFKAVVFIAVIIACVCCVRVGLSAASIDTAIRADELSTQIDEARSLGSNLEVQQSRLSNSTQLRVSAVSLGMSAPEDTVAINLDDDVVVTDASGNLSFSGSVNAIVSQG